MLGYKIVKTKKYDLLLEVNRHLIYTWLDRINELKDKHVYYICISEPKTAMIVKDIINEAIVKAKTNPIILITDRPVIEKEMKNNAKKKRKKRLL